MNTHPLFTLLHLLLNTPGLHTTHHSQGRRRRPSSPKTQTSTSQNSPETEVKREERDGELRESHKSWSQACPRVCVCVESSSMTAVIIFVETTETVGTGSLPSDRNTLSGRRFQRFAPINSVHVDFSIHSLSSPQNS